MKGLLTAALVFVGAVHAEERAWEISTIIPEGKTLVVIGQGDHYVHEDYVNGTGRGAAGYMYYVFLQSEPGKLRARLDRFADELSGDKFTGATFHLGLTMGTSPIWDTLKGDPSPPGALRVVNGEYDDQITILADWLKNLETAAFLRIGYEFDLAGGQWGAAPQYAAAFRYIVDALRDAGVDNAAYVWHSAGAYFRATDYSGLTGLVGGLDKSGSDATAPLAQATTETRDPVTNSDPISIREYYPGSGYVDYFAISYWDDAGFFGRGTPSSRTAYRRRTREILDEAKALGLPLMIGEATPAYIGASSQEESLEWFRGFFGLIRDYDLRATLYISQDWQAKELWQQPQWNGFWPDSRVHTYSDVCTLWRLETSRERYIHGEFIGEPAPTCGGGE